MKTYNLAACIALALACQHPALANSAKPKPPLGVNLSLNPDSIAAGERTALAWSVTGAKECVASATPAYPRWSGNKNKKGGTLQVAPAVSTDFTLTCGNGAESQAATVHLNVANAQSSNAMGPLSLSLSPDRYVAGGYSSITWNSPGAADCVASAVPEYAPWSGHKQPSWGQSVAPDISTVFTLTCTNGTESQTATAALTVTAPPLSLSLSPDTYAVGGYTSINWSWPGATDCVASAVPEYAPWSGHKQPNWGQSVAPDVSTVFTLTCTNGTESQTATAALTVTGGTPGGGNGGGGDTGGGGSGGGDTGGGNGGGGSNPPPSLTLSLSPDTYAVGGYSTILWNWPGATDCVASAVPEYAPWSGQKQPNWGQSVAPEVSTVFTLTCTNGSESQTATASLNVTGSTSGGGSGGSGGGTGGGGSGGGTGGGSGGGDLPVPPVLPTPISLAPVPVNPADPADAPLLDFAHTANREWNYGGHNVPADFSADQGNWDYTPTTYEPWLFDRPTTWYRLYQRTSTAAYRGYFLRDLDWYASHISAQGYFTPKTGEADTKYLYITPFVLYERETGDTQYRNVAQRIWQASRAGFPNTYAEVGNGLWTEREMGIHLEAAVAYYELTGDGQALARAAALVKQWSDMAGTRGAPMVTYTQHEGGGPGGTTPQDLVNSPWMSGLYFQAARRYWQITGDPEVLRQVSAYFDWLTANGLYDGSLAHPEFTGLTFPRYLAGTLIGEGGYDEANMYHCPDVAGLVAFAVDAKQRRGEDTASATQRYNELRACSVRAYANLTRDTDSLPKYRIKPPRMWNWWMRGSYEAALH
jgi:hypothetical protein